MFYNNLVSNRYWKALEMTGIEILSSDIKRAAMEYENAKAEVAECAAKIAEGNFNYCASINSAIKRMEECKIRHESLQSALSTIKFN